MKKNHLIILFVFTNIVKIAAQQEQSLNFVKDIWQVNLTNPAMMPVEKYHITLPSVYFNLNSPNFTINDLVKTNANGEMTLSSLVQSRLQAENPLNGTVEMQSLGTSFRIKDKFAFSIYHSAKLTPNFTVDKDLINLMIDGNSQFIGKTTDFSGNASASLTSELALGLMMKASPNVTLGAKVKMLNGIAGAFAPNNSSKITIVNDNYAMNFDNNLDIKTFSVGKLNELVNPGDLLKKGFFSNNNGVALDLGTVIKTGKWQFNASVVDLGASINWKNEGKNYKSVGKFSYAGINSNAFFDVDSLESASWIDTLKKVVNYTETNSAEYRQTFPTKFYLSANYNLTENFSVGALFYQQMGNNLNSTGLMLDATYNFLHFISAGATVGLRNGTMSNLGAHMVIKAGPVRVFAVTDNVISAFKPYDNTSSNGRLGINFAF
jgi:hypothetical protein